MDGQTDKYSARYMRVQIKIYATRQKKNKDIHSQEENETDNRDVQRQINRHTNSQTDEVRTGGYRPLSILVNASALRKR